MTTTAGDLHAFKAEFFRALAHPVRIRILEALVRGELTVGAIQQQLGLEQSLVSQQLSILRAKNIVAARKHGTTASYTVRDPLLAQLLAVARQIFNNHLVGTRTLLRELQRERPSAIAGSPTPGEGENALPRANRDPSHLGTQVRRPRGRTRRRPK